MDIKQLKTFAVLAKEKNYIKASEVLSYAPSTLAKHIHSLENEFNTAFVKFSNGAIELTPEGIKFLDYANKILQVYLECEADFAQSEQENKISVAGGELMIAFSFGPFFMDYQKHDQNTNVELNTICCAKVPKWLDKQECDIGYVQMIDISDNGNSKVIPLFQEKLCIMTSPNHPLAKQKEVYLKDFNEQSFTFTYAECCFTDKFRNDLKQAGVQLKSELFLGSVTAVVDSCLMHDRLCLIPYVAIDKLKEYGLTQVNWIDAFNIYDCVLTQNTVKKNDKLYPLLEATKEYCLSLKKDNKTKDIVLL